MPLILNTSPQNACFLFFMKGLLLDVHLVKLLGVVLPLMNSYRKWLSGKKLEVLFFSDVILFLNIVFQPPLKAASSCFFTRIKSRKVENRAFIETQISMKKGNYEN